MKKRRVEGLVETDTHSIQQRNSAGNPTPREENKKKKIYRRRGRNRGEEGIILKF